MLQAGRHYKNPDDYNFGFNGKEMVNDWNGKTAAVYDYGFRIYDARIAKFLSVDPLTSSYPWYTPYQFAGNKPICAIDLDGLEELIVIRWYDDGKYRGETHFRIPDKNDRVGMDNMQIIDVDVSEINPKKFTEMVGATGTKQGMENRKKEAYDIIHNPDGSYKGKYYENLDDHSNYQKTLDKLRADDGNQTWLRSVYTTILEPQVVFYEFDSRVIIETNKIDYIQNALKDFPGTTITIDGYASIPGDEDYNLKLSGNRADEAKDYLLSHGITEKEIEYVVGHGETEQFGDTNQANQRVIIDFNKEKQDVQD